MSSTESFIRLAATAAVVGAACVFLYLKLSKPQNKRKPELKDASTQTRPESSTTKESEKQSGTEPVVVSAPVPVPSPSDQTKKSEEPESTAPVQTIAPATKTNEAATSQTPAPQEQQKQPKKQQQQQQSKKEREPRKPQEQKSQEPKEPKKAQEKKPQEVKKPQETKKPASRVSRYAYPPVDPSTLLPLDKRYEISLSVGEECQLKEELKALLENNPSPVAYDGFEPSGRMHIAQGVMKKINVEKLTSSGFTYIFWVADWFAFLNHKMGGDLEKIKTVGRYFIEVWKALGMKMDRVKFLWASDEINSRGDDYWGLVLDISTKFSLTRVKRCGQIMGRKETDTLHSSQILYPCMQSADIFFMEVDVCQLGVDQRKVNMLAREFANKNKQKYKRPVVLSHHMLLGLKQGQDKMSKSDPDSAIFMEDTREEIQRKIMKHAYCPPGQVYTVEKVMVNPVLDYFARVFKGLNGKPVVVNSEAGATNYTTYAELETAFVTGQIKPDDLKASLAIYLEEVIKPVREQFEVLAKIRGSKPEKVVFHKEALSLKKDEDTIGKGNVEGTIFLDDTADEIRTKVTAAYCPPKVFYEKTKFVNPCMDYFKALVFDSFPTVTIRREAKYGGDVTFDKYKDFEASFLRGEIDANDIKQNLVAYIDDLIRPVREHFERDPEAKELLEKVKLYRITK